MNSIGAYIKELRESKELTINDLAKLTLMKERELSLLEDDKIEEMGGFGYAKSCAYSIVKKLNGNSSKLISIIENNYPEEKKIVYKTIGYKEEKKFLISLNYVFGFVIFVIVALFIVYVARLIKNRNFSIVNARQEIEEVAKEKEVEEKVIIELPAPSKRGKNKVVIDDLNDSQSK